MKPKKRLFVGLQTVGLIFLVIAAAAFFYMSIFGINGLRYYLPILLGIFSIFIIFLVLGISGLVLSIVKEKTFSFLDFPTRMTLEFLYPITIWLGRIIGIKRDEVERSFIEVNNQLTRARDVDVEPDDILILVPHCLQRAECPHKITVNIDNCSGCGKCKISDFLNWKQDAGIDVKVVTGGSLARRVIKENNPQAVVAVACERDLASGLQDIFPLPAKGIINIRPHGPCFNTDVNLNDVEGAVKNFLNRG